MHVKISDSDWFCEGCLSHTAANRKIEIKVGSSVLKETLCPQCRKNIAKALLSRLEAE